MPTPPAVAPAETPERLAFYERIGQKHMTPLWTSLSRLVTPEPVSGCQPGARAVGGDRAAEVQAGGGAAPPRGARAAPPHPREPRPARPVEDHHRSLRRRAARVAGRGRARAPAHAK